MGTLNPTHLLTHSFCQHGLCLSKQCTNCSPTNSADDVRLLNRRVAVVSASCRCTCSAITGLARSSRRRRHHLWRHALVQVREELRRRTSCSGCQLSPGGPRCQLAYEVRPKFVVTYSHRAASTLSELAYSSWASLISARLAECSSTSPHHPMNLSLFRHLT